ncbi:uncharacterized protein LOC111323684 isoform X2 [Stylophora pistillata]|nr:uncharacterized protein LOC111323684 isoform X2 [Stylophora pistillata]XP_022782830.1 uncharacterized protein LOC111323684 isoform X2 [Stylophora pistillata]
MKTTTVWYFAIAILVLPVTAFPKSNSTEETPNEGKRFLWGGPAALFFFVGEKRPVGLPDVGRGTEIQQGTEPYFVSLFDPCTNTAFYSAYKVKPTQAKNLGKHSRPGKGWNNPPGVPGVDDAYKIANAETQRKFNAELTRGHMNPSGINSFDPDFMRATFTLTNAVPQFAASNGRDWQVFEKKIKDYAKNTCGSPTRQGTLYLLTGRSENGLNAVPKPPLTDKFTVRLKNIPLATPRAIWTAGCCVWKEPGKRLGSLWKTERAESFAVMSNNHYDQSQLHQTQMSIINLQKHLSSGTKVDLFPGNKNCAAAINNITL